MIPKSNGCVGELLIPPGATLKETLETINMTQASFAVRTGLSEQYISKIVNGEAPITHDTAIKFETVLSIPASFWLNFEAIYREKKSRLEYEKRLEKEAEKVNATLYNKMSSLGWVKPARDLREKAKNLLSFLGFSSFDQIEEGLSTCYRVSGKKTADPIALASMLRKAELEAEAIETKPYSETKLKKVLPQIRNMTNQEPENFIDEIIELCRECGVALVFLPHLPKTFMHGATRWINSKKVIVVVTLRLKTIDQFWFSLFHEFKHVLSHKIKYTFISTGSNSQEEKEADIFATNYLIPIDEYRVFCSRHNFSFSSIHQFACSINIEPTIVIGRLQHDNYVSYNSVLNKRKLKYDWN